ncbi:hypothetical protein [Parasulfitobacter algicola]|uniref:Yip1 domain-containing protein n=1 Tax=Parasulfitobacter algicola TaxID=2614809 RepID=A0ABX2IZN7_9RHOB|nr:hypothetical protein [Sulfitobacter algicola]NSX56241.1 hypothetical protein [Sulfitobacter algicola]
MIGLLFFILYIALLAFVLSLSTKIVIGRSATFSSAFLTIFVSFIFTIIISVGVGLTYILLQTGLDQFDTDSIGTIATDLSETASPVISIAFLGVQTLIMTFSVWAFINTNQSSVRPTFTSSLIITIVNQVILLVVTFGIGFLAGSLMMQQGAP